MGNIRVCSTTGRYCFHRRLSVHTQRVPTLDVAGGVAYLGWWMGGGTYLGWWMGVPTLAGGWGVATLDGGYVPWLMDGGILR